jgi:hypothetical protein
MHTHIHTHTHTFNPLYSGLSILSIPSNFRAKSSTQFLYRERELLLLPQNFVVSLSVAAKIKRNKLEWTARKT